MYPREVFRSMELVAEENADAVDTADEDSSAELLRSPSSAASQRRVSVRLLTVCLGVSAVVAVVFCATSGSNAAQSLRAGAFTSASGLEAVTDSFTSASSIGGQQPVDAVNAGKGLLNSFKKHMGTMLRQTMTPSTYNVSTAAGEAASPLEDRYDGNVCGDDEELLGRLCYKKCSLLTGGQYPHRCTAMSCAREQSCSFTNQKVVMKICGGFDVSGVTSGGKSACPHSPGACLEDEELSLGMCFKKCSLLTNGEYPHRFAAATCCKVEGVQCMKPWNVKTHKDFDVGGGQGDGDQFTPGKMHAPIPELTESTKVVLK